MVTDGILSGIRVIELASWTFVPAAGAVLADWGADVIKVEDPRSGDPGRALVMAGLTRDKSAVAVDHMMQIGNRGKRSVGIDLRTVVGRELFLRMIAGADVFLTNWLPDARRKLRLDVDDLRTVNPKLIYARGSGLGPRGPEVDKGGFDAASYTSRGGVAYALTGPGAARPMRQRPAFGDIPSGMTLAGGIAAALFHRERTGEPSVVDVSLLAQAMWQLGPDIMAAELFGVDRVPMGEKTAHKNPLVVAYRTSDDRWIQLVMLQPDRYWRDLCVALERPELGDDPRFSDSGALAANAEEAIAVLEAVFASADLEHWKARLGLQEGVWEVVQSPRELLADPQALANDYLVEAETSTGQSFHFVSSPVQFDQSPPASAVYPEHGEHTEFVLMELGLDWDQITAAKEAGAVL